MAASRGDLGIDVTPVAASFLRCLRASRKFGGDFESAPLKTWSAGVINQLRQRGFDHVAGRMYKSIHSHIIKAASAP